MDRTRRVSNLSLGNCPVQAVVIPVERTHFRPSCGEVLSHRYVAPGPIQPSRRLMVRQSRSLLMETSTSPISAGTRARIMEAALETLRTDGIVGASARTIAARGGFNQALIFYHFGSVSNLLMQAAAAHSAETVTRYRKRAEGVASLSDLVDLARRLHQEDHENGSVTVVTQLMAGATHDPELARAVMDAFDKWIEVVETALRKVLDDTGGTNLIPIGQAAHAIASMFLGLELMSRLDPDRGDPEALFAMMASLARVVEGLLQIPPSPALTTLFGPALRPEWGFRDGLPDKSESE